MVFNSSSKAAAPSADANKATVLAAASSVFPVNELSAANRDSISKSGTVVHIQRNDQLKAEDSHRWLLYLVEGSLSLYSGKDEIGVLNAGSADALKPLFTDKGAYQSVRTSAMAKVVRFGREQMDILLEEQQKNALNVLDIQVGELDNLIFDDIVKAIETRSTSLAITPASAVKIQEAYEFVDSIPDVAELIQSDAGLAAHVVRCANQADTGASESTSSIRGAITRLGVRETKRHVVGLLQSNAMTPANEVIATRMDRYLKCSFLCASIVQVLTKQVPHLKPEVAMLVAITADIGELLVLTHANQHAEKFTDDQSLSNVIDNLRTIAGSWFVDTWNYPAYFLDATLKSRDWYRTHTGELTYADLVTAALLIINKDMPETGDSSIPNADNLLLARRLQQCGIDITSTAAIISAASSRLASVQTMLKAS